MSAPAAELKNRPVWTFFPRVDTGTPGLWALIVVSSLAVLPPFFYVVAREVRAGAMKKAHV
jgi:hypothetical protein